MWSYTWGALNKLTGFGQSLVFWYSNFCCHFKFTKMRCVNMEVSGVAPSSLSSMLKFLTDDRQKLAHFVVYYQYIWFLTIILHFLHQRTIIIITPTDWLIVVPVVGFDCMQLSLPNVLSTLHHGIGVKIFCLSKTAQIDSFYFLPCSNPL